MGVRAGALSSTRRTGDCRRSWRKIKVTTNTLTNLIHRCSRFHWDTLFSGRPPYSLSRDARAFFVPSESDHLILDHSHLYVRSQTSSPEAHSTTRRSSKTDPTKGRDMFGLVFCATAVLWISGQLLWTTYQHRVVPDHAEQSLHISKSLCKQEQAIAPVNHSDIWSHVLSESKTEQHRSKVVEWLRGAVKIPYVRSLTSEAGSPNKSVTFRTESYDGMEPVGVDPRWEVFKPLHIYLATAFPLVSVYHRLPTHASCH